MRRKQEGKGTGRKSELEKEGISRLHEGSSGRKGLKKRYGEEVVFPQNNLREKPFEQLDAATVHTAYERGPSGFPANECLQANDPALGDSVLARAPTLG